ncbi:hypothetical protein ACFE04_020980 [Oxalis oulophora]
MEANNGTRVNGSINIVGASDVSDGDFESMLNTISSSKVPQAVAEEVIPGESTPSSTEVWSVVGKGKHSTKTKVVSVVSFPEKSESTRKGESNPLLDRKRGEMP